MILVLEIAMLVAGLIALCSGRLQLSKERAVEGPAVRVAGAVLMLPLLLAFMIGIVLGAREASRGRQLDLQEWGSTMIGIELGLIVVFGTIAGILLWTAAPKKRKRARRRRNAQRDDFAPLPEVETSRADRLSDDLVEAGDTEQEDLLEQMQEAKGSAYTDALALAIPRLEGQTKQKARAALLNRLTRLTPETLLSYMEEDDPEIRRAALLASATRDLREHIPAIIEQLTDSKPTVARAAHAALKTLTGKDFGPSPDATFEERNRAIETWQKWWKRQEIR